MTSLTLTCDREAGLIRVAVWQGAVLRDLYLDSVDKPNLTGAIVCGKVMRVNPAQKTAYINFGETGLLQNALNVKAGQKSVAQIVNPAHAGKAAVCRSVAWPESAPAIGILAPPPTPWHRAIGDLGKNKIGSITFGNRADYLDYKKGGDAVYAESPHPDLSEQLDKLCEKTVALPCGGSIIIECTAAFVAVDVNAGEAKNALTVNLQAVREAARQMRLRNLSGTFVIDCLKMPHRTDQAKILNALKTELATDPAGARVAGFTKLGLLEGTRTRRGPSLEAIWKPPM